MKKNILLLLIFAVIPLSFSQDNIYGDYLISDTDKIISLNLEGASLVDVLKMISQQVGLNFVSTEAVRERKLTLYMEKVPLKEAMDTIFKANNLTYDYYPEANIFVVKEMGKPSVELKTKVYYLKYARVKSSKIEKEIEDNLGTTRQEERTTTATETEESESIKETVEKVLSEFGKVSEDPITNSLIVVDVPSQFPVIDELIDKLDTPPPKVMIEVEMLDVSKRLIDKIGFNFANGLYGKFTPGSFNTPFPFPRKWVSPGTIKWTSTPTRELTLGTLDLSSFTTVLQFLTTDTSTKILARPKILTLSNQTSEVNLTIDEVIGLTTTTTEGGTTQESVERGETGTKLRVTPQVNPDTKEITLFLQFFNREAKDSGFTQSGLGNSEIPNIEERGTKSVVRLKNGETLMIGGLIRNKTEETITKIPLLGDMPFLGRLFRYKNKDNEERELLVFLTPQIIEDGAPFAKANNIFHREQADYLRKSSIKFALDKFSK
jgi:type II secretory pathway component GspD/PulD (secretin)